MHRLISLVAVTCVAATALAGSASAHVTLQPAEVPAGTFKRLDVRVPNERDDAATRKVQVQFPAGFIFVSYEPVAGWSTKVTMAKLDEPVEVFGEQHAEQVDRVTFTATGKGIAPGQFQDFGLSVGLPDKPAATLTFKALQTYSGGEVVRWIGAPDSDRPAPQVKLVAAPEGGAAAHRSGAAAEDDAAVGAAAAATAGDDDGADMLSVVALIIGGLGLLAGLAGLAAARRSRSSATA